MEFDDWFKTNITNMDEAVEAWKQVEKGEELLQVVKGRFLRNVDRYIDGGLSGFCEHTNLARRTAYYYIDLANIADNPKVCNRLHTLGTANTAIIERTPHPELIYDWVDEQEKIPSQREIKTKIVDTFKPDLLPVPEGKYNVIVIDSPWPCGDVEYEYRDRSSIHTRSIERPYHQMSIEEITRLDIPAADDCVLWLWTTNINLHNAFHVLEAWGFEYRSCLTWAKPTMGLGYWLRGQTEHCLLATKGSPEWTNTRERTLLKAERRQDSRKPDQFYAMVDRICQGPKIDMFSREKREGWDQWGDETDRF